MQSRPISAWFPVTLGRFVILVSILLMNIGTPPAAVAAAASGETPGKIYLPVISNGKAKIDNPTPPTPLPPTAQQLIKQDYAAKLIDYNTTLLYLGYAEFGDPRLPARYGGGFMVADPTFISFAGDPTLPADVKAKLEPFLVRPDDPRSVYNAAPAGIAPAGAQANSLACDPYGWTFQDAISAEYNFRIHAKCNGTEAGDIQTTISYITALWGPMTGLMGKPMLDDGGQYYGGSQGIDIYLLNPLDEFRRYKAEANPLCEFCGGMVAPSATYNGDKSSSYILMDRKRTGEGIYYKQLLAHEFFHSLEFAHNKSVTSVNGIKWWFAEASAVWAEQYFVQEASAKTHQRFSNGFQYSYYLSLHAPGDNINDPNNFGHIYDAYIWPFFMEQERGAESIASAWTHLETVGINWTAALQVVSDELPFDPNFRRFALRNLNFDLEPGNPIQPRYINNDPNFPDGVKPYLMVEPQAFDARAAGNYLTYDAPVSSLSAKYYHFSFNSSVSRVDLDLGQVAGLNKVAVQAIVKPRGKPWEVRELTGQSNPQLCDIEGLYLIISNERMALNDTANISFNLSPLAEICNCQQVQDAKSWDGQVTLSYTISAASSQTQVSETTSTSVTAHLTESYRNSSAIGYWAENLGGNGKIHYRNLRLYPTGNYLWSDILGDGPPTPYEPLTGNGSRMALTFDLQKCTYSFYIGVWIMATEDDDSSAPTVKNVGIAHAGSTEYPVPDLIQNLTITDSDSFPGHTTDYVMSSTEDLAFFAQDDYDIYTILGGENNLGAAAVNWVFTPSSGQ